jgi:hypothetical protein
MKRFSTLSIAVAALLLAGCAPTPAPSASDSPPASETPAPETPEVDPSEERSDYGFTYFYEADLGGTWDEMSAQLRYPVAGNPDCPYFGTVWSTEAATTSAFMDETDLAAGARFFYTMEGWATSTATYPRNAEGVGIGSTEAEVLAAFPTAVVGSMVDLGAGDITTITVDDPDSESKYVYGFNGTPTVNLLQWGPDAGNQWSHLCGGF